MREHEHVVPQPRLEMRFELGQVEIRPGAARNQFLGVVEEIEPEIEQAAGHRAAVDLDVLLRQVPAARAHQQHRGLLVEAIGLAAAAIVEGDLAAHRVHQVALAVELVGPGRRGRILEVRHVAGGAGIERVDHHLAVDRAGDLDAAVSQVLGQRRHLPVAGADVRGLFQEVRLLAGIEPLLPILARLEQAQALGPELAFELRPGRPAPPASGSVEMWTQEAGQPKRRAMSRQISPTQRSRCSRATSSQFSSLACRSTTRKSVLWSRAISG